MIRYLLILLGILALLLHLVGSALVTAGILHATGFTQVRSVVIWIASAPVLYLLWLLVLVLLFMAEAQILSRLAPKPRRLSAGDGPRAMLRLVGLAGFYRRAIMLASLPLTATLFQIPGLRTLILLAYAPSAHIGKRVVVYGRILDPDLTHIGDGAVIGANASLVAHTMTTGSDGKLFYASAPITIGPGAVVGGESFIAMGVTVGEGAVIELGSTVVPYTVVPPREVWGGNPAVFLRRRPGAAHDEQVRQDEPRQHSTPQAAAGGPPAPAEEEIRRLVAEALDLPLDRVRDDLGQANCLQWDSLGQMALAAAVYDRFGVTLSHEQVFSIRTLPDLVRAVHSPAPLPHLVPLPHLEDGSAELVSPPEDPEMLPLLDHEAATRSLARRDHGRARLSSWMEMPIAIAASFTAEPLAASLKLWSRAFGVDAQVRFCDFDQVVQVLLSPDSPLHADPGGMKVVLVRPEDLPGSTREERSGSAARVLEAVEQFASTTAGGGALVVGTLPPPVSDHFEASTKEVEGLRVTWHQRLAGTAGVEVLHFAAVVERVGTASAASPGFDVIARAPYSPRVYQELGIELARLVRRRSGLFAPAKVIALDCDGTLWGGVVAEDGPDGIELGPDGRGRGYQLFQKALLRLKERGVLLALVSRNEEVDVWEVFDHHPGMVLARRDIAAWRIDWADKSESLRELAEELNLGLDSIVFVDDDPAIRLEVIARAPQVKVVPLSGEPEQYAGTLGRLWLFDRGLATAEDLDRTRMIQQEGKRRRSRETVPCIEDYLRQLELRVDFRRAGEADLPRVAQLTQKTNQFNLSLRRRSLEEIQALGPEVETYVVSARDRFGDYGTIGVGILAPAGEREDAVELDTLLVSCRALGRGIEQAFLERLCKVARARGARRLKAPFVKGPRNQPVLRFLRQGGFVAQDGDVLQRPLEKEIVVPGHIQWEGMPAARR